MLFKSKLEKFVAKRIAVLLLICSVITLICCSNRWAVIAGLAVGALLSTFRFVSYAWMFGKIASVNRSQIKNGNAVMQSVLVFTMNQIILLPVLYLAYQLSQWFFWGLVAGVLLAPLAIVINSVTEVLGITKNGFFV